MKIRFVAISTGIILTISLGMSIFGSVSAAMSDTPPELKYSKISENLENDPYLQSSFLFVCPFH
ncbi:MAG TPA: hypothetical protein DEZ08_06200 [Dehalococcoidia bacterium]|jgi:hypothetical protein|nr:hypothetical protein [Dehalococcoidia bacterium]